MSIILALLIAGCGPGEMVNCGGRRALPLLTCTGATSCDLHFVANDWSGSGDWTSRDSNAWVGVPAGTNVKTNASRLGRSRINQTASSATRFITADNAAHVVDGSQTLEVIAYADSNFRWLVETSTNHLANDGATGIDIDGNGYVRAHVANSAGTVLWTRTGSTNHVGQFVFITAVTDTGSSVGRLYVNGVQIGADVAFSGSVSTGSVDRFLIGASQGVAGNSIVEVVRHRSALDASTITARTAKFNQMKGY